jgi:hypothetical protein
MTTLDIEIYTPSEIAYQKGVQCRFLVRGHDDVMWTDSLEDAVSYLRSCVEAVANDPLA